MPRIAIVNFDEEVLYYSDFCLRYEDWVETKLTQGQDGMPDEPLMMYSEKATTADWAASEAQADIPDLEAKEDGNMAMEDCEAPDEPMNSDDE